MKIEIEDLTPQDIEKVFWKAVEKGWGSGKIKKQESPLLPWYKCIEFFSGKFRVLDTYCTTPLNDKSVGFTIIWFDDIPIWTMNYGGEYPEHTIPFLKLALQSTIIRRDFIGGRGPSRFTHEDYPDLIYTNNVYSMKRAFSNFSGQEHIYEKGNLVGHHDYWGMSLI
jgi:hypothetical protein